MGNRIREEEGLERGGCDENHTQTQRNPICVVADTNIFISSIFWKGPPHKIIQLAVEGRIDIFISKMILDELRKVLKRDFGAPDEKIEEVVLSINSYAKLIELENIPKIIIDDPFDDHILACAVNSDAEYIITGDNHLLNLKEYNGIKILKPAEFLKTFN